MKENNASFIEILDKLNPEQRTAVDTIEGPVMVVAGPGTGKTQILAARIGNILLNTDALPHSILCLTYTESGAVAMRKRLFEFIGKDAYRVNIFTFHGFCNSVIQENRHLFGHWDLQPISDLEKTLLYKQHIFELPFGNTLKRETGDTYYEKFRMEGLFEFMKKENYTPELISEKIDQYLADLPLREEYIYKKANAKTGVKVGDLKEAAIKKQTENMELLRAATKEFQPFQARMKANSRYGFSDMISWVNKAFSTNEDLLRTYQERFLYILVDEYQDTSGSQNELLYKLADYWDDPNLFVVGDDDQSIFKFQGANVENIMHFRTRYPNACIVPLVHNYRSTQAILSTAQGLIENNKERLVGLVEGLSKDLISSNPLLEELNVAPIVTEYANEIQEATSVAKQLLALRDEGHKLNEIAVIYSKHKQANGLMKFLQLQGVPINARRKANILEEPVIRQITEILSYIDAELRIPNSGEEKLFSILHYNLYNTSPIKIAKLSAKIFEHNVNNRRSGNATTWRAELSGIANTGKMQYEIGFDNATIDEYTELRRVMQQLEACIKDATSLTLPGLVELIINQCGFLAYAIQSGDKLWLMQVLNTFFDFVQEETTKKPFLTLSAFMQILDDMQTEKIAININKVIADTDGVNFITAHSSKGLEYDTVFMIGCNKGDWESKSGSNSMYKLPDTLISQSEDETEETRRLFYVAMTRARKSLRISYPAQSNNKDTEPSRFVAEVMNVVGIEKLKPEAAEDEAVAFYMEKVLEQSEKATAPRPEKEFIEQLLERFTLSTTSLNTYLKCPVSFYYNHLIRVPSAGNEYTGFGTAVHDTLDWFFKKMKANNGEFPSKPDMLENFRKQMKRNEAFFTKDKYVIRSEYGFKILSDYFDKNIKTWSPQSITEVNLNKIEIEGVPVKGNLDKIEFDGNDITIIDYKTGRYDKAKKRLMPPKPNTDIEHDKPEDVYGGDYWRQAVFYKLLVDNYKLKNWNVRGMQFDFVEPDKDSGEYKAEKMFITKEHEAIVTKQITETYTNIRAHKIYDGCNKPDCEWCSFVKSLPAEFKKSVVMQEAE